MNYRHAFHAGNFADLLKHALLTELMARLTASPGPLVVIDTHAGAGLYDLGDVPASRTGEAAAGIERLLAEPGAPSVFGALKVAVAAVRKGGARLYPGSPALIIRGMRREDRYVACELRPDDFQLLRQTLGQARHAEAVQADGYATAAARVGPGRMLVLIDPPFEAADDYERIVATAGAVLRRNRAATVAVWLPIKDLDTLDRFQGRMEALKAPGLLAQVRLRPLMDPMKMNGCAMLVLNPPQGLEGAARAAAEWIAGTLGESGALGRVDRL